MSIICFLVRENHKMVREMSGKSQGILWGLMAGHPEYVSVHLFSREISGESDSDASFSDDNPEYVQHKVWNDHISGLVPDCSNSIANALELLLPCAKALVFGKQTELPCSSKRGTSNIGE